MKKLLLLLAVLTSLATTLPAQRHTDTLGRGLVAAPALSGNLVSWRRLAHEYYDVTYNLYRNGTIRARNLKTTTYLDSQGGANSKYEVQAVIGGIAGDRCEAVSPWSSYKYTLGGSTTPSGYLDIELAPVYDRKGNDVTQNYSPNDAEMADLNGDGELDIIIKRLNTVDASISAEYGEMYSSKSTQFVVLDAYTVDWQTGEAQLLWRIDCGPNMVSLNSTEIDIIAFDWDEDGKAEAVLRGADNMIIYSGQTLPGGGYLPIDTIGTVTNSRKLLTSHTNSQYAWTKSGSEYLIYINGETGQPYQVTTYPLKRLENNESNINSAWGDDYGHRATKHFLGAPFLDGRKASLFLGRGIYTRHKMIAMDLDPATHTWSERWRWNCNNSKSPWYGNGYHNFVVADVDEDGRDEIVYGSMVIDDNGQGLSTTGLGHGDAQAVTDFNPYRKGLEFFGCLEEKKGNFGCNYRDATTSELLYKHDGTGDDGRSLMANFSNKYPGSLGRSTQSGMINTVTCTTVPELGGDSFINWGDLNFRIYFDGDLCSEILNSPGEAKDAKVEKPGVGRLFTTEGCNMNNDSKNNPCFQGDIIGDWREEIVLRRGTNLRVYTTAIETSYSMPSLWFDHQYRQAMVWQMMAYNQPPYVSYFLGELEGITVAPPPLTNTERDELHNGATISADQNGFHLMMAETGDMTVSVAEEGAAPRVLTVNTPSWVQGSGSNTGITAEYYTHTITGGPFTGKMHLAKQGDGTLVLPNVEQTYTGETNVWAGTLCFDGTMKSSQLWLNRFTTLKTSGGTFSRGISMDYASRLLIGSDDKPSTVTVNTLTLNIGARVVIDLFAEGDKLANDTIDAKYLSPKTVDWQYGPQYLKPVIEFVAHGELPASGTFVLGDVERLVGTGDLSDFVIVEGLDGVDYELKLADGKMLLVIGKEEVSGDVNGDGSVDVGDIMSIINYMAGAEGISESLADVNRDGSVDVGDIMAIINIMANSPAPTATTRQYSPITIK